MYGSVSIVVGIAAIAFISLFFIPLGEWVISVLTRKPESDFRECACKASGVECPDFDYVAKHAAKSEECAHWECSLMSDTCTMPKFVGSQSYADYVEGYPDSK